MKWFFYIILVVLLVVLSYFLTRAYFIGGYSASKSLLSKSVAAIPLLRTLVKPIVILKSSIPGYIMVANNRAALDDLIYDYIKTQGLRQTTIVITLEPIESMPMVPQYMIDPKTFKETPTGKSSLTSGLLDVMTKGGDIIASGFSDPSGESLLLRIFLSKKWLDAYKENMQPASLYASTRLALLLYDLQSGSISDKQKSDFYKSYVTKRWDAWEKSSEENVLPILIERQKTP